MENWQDALIRWSARVVVVFFFAGVFTGVYAATKRSASRMARAHRWIWLCGAMLLLFHDGLAMGLAHGWSHARAVEHTAERTRILVGFQVGWGLYLNYLMSAWWVADAGWLSLRWESYLRRPKWLGTTMWAFFAFMVFNATVVFESGFSRVMGLLGFGTVATLLVIRLNRLCRDAA